MLKDYLEKYNNIEIFRRQRPDLDAYGAQLGLYHILKTNFPEKKNHHQRFRKIRRESI